MRVFFQNRLLELGFNFRNLLRRWVLQRGQRPPLTDRPQRPCRRVAAHHADAAVRPTEQKARIIRPSRHAIIARPVTDPVQQGDARHVDIADRHHHLCPIFGDAADLILPPDHKTGDVLQKQQRRAALAA